MIAQIRHLPSRAPFETFSIELANGRVIQIHDRHLVATTDGVQPGEAVIGLLYASGTFELINANQVASVSLDRARPLRPDKAGKRRVCKRLLTVKDII
jgi:hypothetical protein